jgi:hypothetical protein
MTSTEIPPPTGGEVLDRSSGELIDLREASTDRLARFLDETAELLSLVKEARAQVDREVLRRMDEEATWTARVGSFELRAPSPEAGMTYHDADALEEALDDLVERGLVSEQAATAALEVETRVERKTRQGGIRALLRLGEVAEAVAACERRREEPPRRSVRVRRRRD